MTAKSVLNSSLCVSIIVYNVPVVVTGIHMGNVGLRVVGWNLLGIGIVGTAVLPISGNPALIVLGVLILRAASRVGARAGPQPD